MPTLQDLRLDFSASWSREQEDDTLVIWRHENGDGIGVYYFDLRPDIGARLEDIDELRSYYRDMVVGAGGGLIQVDVVHLQGVAAVETIVKVPQEPTGMTYVASMTLPFAGFSFVIKAMCEENGVTGMREAVVASKSDIEIDDSGCPLDWAADPYDLQATAKVMCNKAEDPKFDEEFPLHPLSRCRQYMSEVKTVLSLSESVQTAARFSGPSETKKKSWWPFGKR